MANAPWRCEHPDGDVKIAVREDHVNKLEAKGYTCVLNPDAVFDEHDTSIYHDVGELEMAGEVDPEPVVYDELNPVLTSEYIVLSNGNRTATNELYDDQVNTITVGHVTTGYKYWEVEVSNIFAGLEDVWYAECGMVTADTPAWDGDYPSQFEDNGFIAEIASEWYDANTLWTRSDNSPGWVTYDSYGHAEVGTVYAYAVDIALGKAWIKIVGQPWAGGGDPALGTSPTITFTPGDVAVSSSLYLCELTFNFGNEPFAGTIPAGFEAWG